MKAEQKLISVNKKGSFTMYDALYDWLMSGDPSIRYQTLQDLLEGSKEDIRLNRMYIEIEGWGKQLLDLQESNGTWANTHVDPEFTSTLWTITILRRLGLERDNQRAIKAAKLLLNGLQKNGGISYPSEIIHNEVCISALVLAATSYFRMIDKKREAIFEFLIESQMDDFGWNCKWNEEAKNSSFHSTLLVLEALREFSRVKKEHLSLINKLQSEGQEFLLSHNLFLSLKTTEIEDMKFLDLVHPQHWHYDVLSALDYFQSINHPYDVRFNSAIDLIKLREKDGLWYLDKLHTGESWFIMEHPEAPSRWITLKVMRVLKWWLKISKFKQ